MEKTVTKITVLEHTVIFKKAELQSLLVDKLISAYPGQSPKFPVKNLRIYVDSIAESVIIKWEEHE